MIVIGQQIRVVKTVVKDAAGKRKLVQKFENGDQPITKIVANEPVRLTRGTLNGHFCRDRNRPLVVR